MIWSCVSLEEEEEISTKKRRQNALLEKTPTTNISVFFYWRHSQRRHKHNKHTENKEVLDLRLMTESHRCINEDRIFVSISFCDMQYYQISAVKYFISRSVHTSREAKSRSTVLPLVTCSWRFFQKIWPLPPHHVIYRRSHTELKNRCSFLSFHSAVDVISRFVCWESKPSASSCVPISLTYFIS